MTTTKTLALEVSTATKLEAIISEIQAANVEAPSSLYDFGDDAIETPHFTVMYQFDISTDETFYCPGDDMTPPCREEETTYTVTNICVLNEFDSELEITTADFAQIAKAIQNKINR